MGDLYDPLRESEIDDLVSQIVSLTAENNQVRKDLMEAIDESVRLTAQVESLQQKVHLTAGYDNLTAENTKLRDALEALQKRHEEFRANVES